MTKEEFTAKIQEITTNLNDQGKVTSELTNLYNEFANVVDANETLTTANNDLTAKNQELKDYNMELFMKVGKQEKEKDGDLSSKAQDDKEEPKLRYEDLFNEKGEFK